MATIEAKHNESYIVVATNHQSEGIDAEEFFTKSGWLSAHALGLGYMESAEGVRLGRAGGSEFYVEGRGEREWFSGLNAARKEFVKRVKDELRRQLRQAGGAEL